jgi:hypothetical protein
MEAMAAAPPEAAVAETNPAPETAEKPAEQKKPARKKVAHDRARQPQNFFDFFTGGRSWDNRSYDNRNRSARAYDNRNGSRPFF